MRKHDEPQATVATLYTAVYQVDLTHARCPLLSLSFLSTQKLHPLIRGHLPPLHTQSLGVRNIA
jgi:hypothetical protein